MLSLCALYSKTRRPLGSLLLASSSCSPSKVFGLRRTNLKETTGGEFRVCRASIKASIRYIDLL